MNLDDRRKWEATVVEFTNVTVATTDTQLVKGASARVALTISPPDTNDVFIMPGKTAALATGFRLAAAHPPLVLTLQNVGNLLLGEWRAIADTGAEVLGVADVRMIH